MVALQYVMSEGIDFVEQEVQVNPNMLYCCSNAFGRENLDGVCSMLCVKIY